MYKPGTLHPTNHPDPALIWRIKLQVLDMQARTYQHDKEPEWIPRLLSTLREINTLALSGQFVPSEAAAAFPLDWYANLTNRLIQIFAKTG